MTEKPTKKNTKSPEAAEKASGGNALLNAVWVLPGIGGTKKLLLAYLADLSRRDGKCHPGINHLSAVAGRSRLSVLRALADLEERGFLSVRRDKGKGNIYQVQVLTSITNDTSIINDTGITNDIKGVSLTILGGIASDTGVVSLAIPKPYITIKTTIKQQPTPLPPLAGGEGESEESFNIFFTAYPRKVAKPAALRAWRALKPDADLLKVILADVESKASSQEWEREDGRYIPHPASYLRGERWTDKATDNVGINYTRQEGGDDEW